MFFYQDHYNTICTTFEILQLHFSCFLAVRRTKSHVLGSLFNKVAELKDSNLIEKETLTQVYSCEYCEIFKNCSFIEHLWWLLLFRILFLIILMIFFSYFVFKSSFIFITFYEMVLFINDKCLSRPYFLLQGV